MKILRLFALLFIYSASAASQDDAVKSLEFWWSNQYRAEQIYDEILDLSSQNIADSVILFKSKEALTCIDLAIKHCNDAKQSNSKYKFDADYMITESCILALWFNQLEVSNNVFTDSIAFAYLDTCYRIRPNVLSIPYYQLIYKPGDVDDLNQSYYNQVFLRFMLSLKHWQKDKVYNSGDEYLTNLMHTYDRDFPAVLFSDDSLKFEQSRVYLILNEIPNFTENVNEKLELSLLMVEYYANFYYYEKEKDLKFELNSVEKEKISSCENYIIKNPDNFIQIEESYLRLADAYFLFGDFHRGINYYSRGIETNSTSDDIKKFIALTKSVGDTSTNLEIKLNCKLLVDNAAGKLYNYYKQNSMNGEGELKYLLECYKFSENEDKQMKINQNLDKIEAERLLMEEKLKRREKFGFRLGVAPLKILNLDRYNQWSLMVDIKINGFEQGFRYCRYDNFTDYYRFGAWIHVGDLAKSSNTYSGNEFSYWVIIYDFNDDYAEHKFCVEARVGKYKFDTVVTNVINREFDEIQFYDYDVNAVAHRYDLNLVYRVTMFAAEIFFLELNFSSGIGFRYLSSEFNHNTFLIDDVRYSDSRWPMITAPLRIGFRAGIRFL